MIRQNYYYLVAGLPDITIDQGKLQFGTAEFREELKYGLTESDYNLLELLFLAKDNHNLLALLRKDHEAVSDQGVYSIDFLTEELREPLHLKPYMIRFIENFRAETPQYPDTSPENELASLWYGEMLQVKNAFLHDWFEFELNLKNVLLVLSAKKHALPYDNQVIGDNEVAGVIRRSNARDLGIAAEWPAIERVVQLNETEDLMAKEKAIDQLRWGFLDELNTFNYFTVEVLMAYYLKLEMIERWLRLDPASGEELFRKLLGELQNSYEFPNEFSIRDGRT